MVRFPVPSSWSTYDDAVTLRLEMLQVARLAPRQLEEATEPIKRFLDEQWTPEGGARDRSGKSDLYYTPFLLECCSALQHDLPHERVAAYLEGFGDGSELDIVHVASLVRSWKALGKDPPASLLREAPLFFAERRTADGGYGVDPDDETGSLYGAFLALGVHQDLGLSVPEPARLADSIARLRCRDGGYADSFELLMGTTPTTAAAVTLLRHLARPTEEEVCAWLLSRTHAQGGFLAMPEAPLPDLLSTATALHALAGAGVSFERVRERCLDFLDSLWTGQAFVGTWDDDDPDCEYTFYALLALGHLAL